MKRSRLEKDRRKARHNGPQEGDRGEGLCLHSQEVQDLCDGCTVHGGQEDRTFDIHLPVDT
jgi:hypothetical protein